MKFWSIIRRLFLFICVAFILTKSTPTFITLLEKARFFTRDVEFDFVTWTIKAFGVKLGQSEVDAPQLLADGQQHDAVIKYIDLTSKLQQVQAEIELIYTDPSISNPAESARDKLAYQQQLQSSLDDLAPLAESILEEQISQVLVDMGISRIGDDLPPVLFHTTPLPKALIVSPRNVIQQEVNISLLADLTLEQITELESSIEKNSDSSALVVDVGGIGVYPTMVMRSSHLAWIIDTIAHEWVHNYLTLRPLGMNYETTPELRTMNETTASIAGGEISQEVMRRFYPELVSSESSGNRKAALNKREDSFDFRAEMHETRVRADELLEEGKIDEAEKYMEERRIVFVEHGYMIRRLNQAYFAFHGAYADQPGGAAGEDPVGPAVRSLRLQCDSLALFLRTIARMTSFSELQQSITIQ